MIRLYRSLQTVMSDPINEGVIITATSCATHSLTGHEPGDASSAASSSSSPVTSQKAAKKIKAATDT